ncbi:hypothetical protein LCGC14_1873210, partial [marine sediment metagenome]
MEDTSSAAAAAARLYFVFKYTHSIAQPHSGPCICTRTRRPSSSRYSKMQCSGSPDHGCLSHPSPSQKRPKVCSLPYCSSASIINRSSGSPAIDSNITFAATPTCTAPMHTHDPWHARANILRSA